MSSVDVVCVLFCAVSNGYKYNTIQYKHRILLKERKLAFKLYTGILYPTLLLSLER